MHRLLAAHRAAQHLDGAVGDHLVGVHVGLGAGAGLPDHQREVVVELAVDDLLRGLGDRLAQLRVDVALRDVDQRAGLLDDAKRADDGDGLLFPADREVLIERWVCAPQYLSAGTSSGPKLSVSVRVWVMVGALSRVVMVAILVG